jgi:hypothetical protein
MRPRVGVDGGIVSGDWGITVKGDANDKRLNARGGDESTTGFSFSERLSAAGS